MCAGVRKLGSVERGAKQSVDAFVEAVGQKDALQELQVSSLTLAAMKYLAMRSARRAMLPRFTTRAFDKCKSFR